MKIRSLFMLSVALVSTVTATQAVAQDESGVVLMRRLLDPKTREYSWVPGDWSQCSNSCGAGQQTRSVQCMLNGSRSAPEVNCGPDKPADTQSCYDIQGCSYTWQPGEWTDVAGCGSVIETRDISCLRGDGETVPNDQCPAPAPETSRTVRDLRTCSYEWKADQWSAFSSECQTAAISTRQVWCERSNGEKVTDAECAGSGAKPMASRTEDRYGQCGYSWNSKAWSAWSSSCQTGATRTRTVVCTRSNGDEVADSFCGATGPKPEVSQQSDQYGSCSYSWRPEEWGAVVPACGPSKKLRDISCVRSNGDVVDGSLCDAGTKPATEEAATDYSTCTYGWTPGAWSAWSSSCGDATQTRAVTCQSSDGRTVADSFCGSAGAKPVASQSAYQTSGCGYSWQTGSYGAPAAACGTSSQTRSVTCLRSDGQTVADASCAGAGAKPASTQPATDYSTCGYSWNAAAWGAWSTTCGNATSTRSVTCLRSDGTTVADASCAGAGAKPAVSQMAYQTSGCGYSWQSGGWGTPAAACGSTTQNRSVWCLRSDGQTVADALCPSGSKPATSQAATDYSACGYGWAYGGWSTSSQTCGNITQTRSVWCQRSDGASVADSFCGSGKPAGSQSWADYSTCSYSAVNPGAWGAWNSTCSSSAYRSRHYQCRRSDGTIVADSECTNRGISLDEGQNAAVYDSCSYAVSGWSSWSYASSCSASTTATQTATGCRRSDGTMVALSECSNRGIATTQTTQTSNISGCGYSWQTGGWSAQQNVCTTGTQTRSVWCQRSDGATVDGSLCGGSKPAATQSYSNTNACTYSASFGAWSACSGGSQSRSVTCTRSDGAVVASSMCGYASSAETQSCGPRYIKAPIYYPSGNATLVTNFAGSRWGGEMAFYPMGYAYLASALACVDTAVVGMGYLEAVDPNDWSYFGVTHRMNFNNIGAAQAGFVDMGNCISDGMKYNYDPGNDWINWYQARGNGVWAVMTNQNTATGVLAPMGRIPANPQYYAGEGYKVAHYNAVPFNFNNGSTNVSPQYSSASMPYWLYVTIN